MSKEDWTPNICTTCGVGRYEEKRCQKIFDKMVILREELKSLNQNKDNEFKRK